MAPGITERRRGGWPLVYLLFVGFQLSAQSLEQASEYRGERRDGVAHGFGRMTFSNGDVYEGDFVNGERSGQWMSTRHGRDSGTYVMSSRPLHLTASREWQTRDE